MKKLTKAILPLIMLIVLSTLSLRAKPVYLNYAKADTTIDPKKHPGAIDLQKHPEVMAKVKEMLTKGKIAYQPKSGNIDSLAVLAKNRQVIRDIITYLIRERIVKDRAGIDSFLLTDTEFVVNGKKLSAKQHDFLKKQYIPEPGYVVYYGDDKMKGNGIFQRSDNL